MKNIYFPIQLKKIRIGGLEKNKPHGLLVSLGSPSLTNSDKSGLQRRCEKIPTDITAFTPATYQPCNLQGAFSSDSPCGFSEGRPNLEWSFPLRCFQRLSLPNIATQQCSWRNNWYTRGSSIPVLSY